MYSLYNTMYFHVCYYCYIVFFLQLPMKLPMKCILLPGDSLARHNGNRFSAFDRDQDSYRWGHCSRGHLMGGFWFHNCKDTTPNALYQWKGYRLNDGSGLLWGSSNLSQLKAIAMKVKRFRANLSN